MAKQAMEDSPNYSKDDNNFFLFFHVLSTFVVLLLQALMCELYEIVKPVVP